MSNNVGLISSPIKLSRTLGSTSQITDPSVITSISGGIDLGFIAFDTDGTMGVCTELSRDVNDNPIYTFKTMTIDVDVDITNMLNQDY